MEIFKSIIPALFFLVINGAFSMRVKKGFGKVLPLTFMLSSLIICFSQLIFNTFNVGFYCLAIIFVISLLYVIKNKEDRNYMFTNGLYIYLILLVIFLFIDFGRYFYWDDEIGFWGKMVKEMFRLDKFYFVDESLLRGHNDYPPFISCFEYLWCKLALGYSECNITCSLHMFEFGLIIPMVFDKEKADTVANTLIKDFLLSLIIIGLVVYLDAGDVFNTIYVDSLVGIEFVYACYLVYKKEIENSFGVVCFVLSMVMIIWTKQVGLAFVLLVFAYYFLSSILNKNKKCLIVFVLAIVAPLAAYLLWNKIIEPYYIIKQFDFSKISIEGLKIALSGTTYQYEVIKMYINALFKNAIYSNPIKIVFVSSLFLELLIIEIIKSYSSSKREKTLIELICMAGTGGYALLMLVLYVFCYPEREAIVLTCYSRYMSSMLTGLVLFIAVVGLEEFITKTKKNQIRKLLIVSLIVISVMNSNRMLSFIPQVMLGNRYAEYKRLAEEIDSKVEEGSLVYILYNHDEGASYPACTSYYSDKTYYTKTNEDFNKNDYSSKENYQKALDELSTYDYIYIIEASKSFNDLFSKLNNNDSFVNNAIYKVEKTDDSIRFVRK